MSVESMNATNVAAAVQTTASQQTHQAKPDAAEQQKQAIQAVEQVKQSQEMSVEEVQAVVDKLNEFMQNGQRNLNFSVDKDTDNVVVKVMDKQTQEVIRQFPSEETLKLTKHIEGMLGLIFNDRA
jgi:flagellar protein FlaG